MNEALRATLSGYFYKDSVEYGRTHNVGQKKGAR